MLVMCFQMIIFYLCLTSSYQPLILIFQVLFSLVVRKLVKESVLYVLKRAAEGSKNWLVQVRSNSKSLKSWNESALTQGWYFQQNIILLRFVWHIFITKLTSPLNVIKNPTFIMKPVVNLSCFHWYNDLVGLK